jgi:uncharacterized protein (TIGR03000 family)
MYSLLMMAAMASAPETTDFGWRFAGCTGCTGYASCYGSSCYGSSCYGSSCYGSSCHGGGLFPRLRGLFGGGCVGSCYGSCYGSSCHGTAVTYSVGCYGSSCHGSSCYGSCYGTSCYGSSCHGSSCYAMPPAGCYGNIMPYGASCYGSTVNLPGLMGSAPSSMMIIGSNVPAAPVYGNAIEGTSTIISAKAVEPAPAKAIATLVLELPAKAALTVDGQTIAGEGTSRSFHTPELVVGQTYYYDFKAEVMVDGKPTLEEKRIVVRAGDKLTESFPKLLAAVKTNSSTVASK